MNEHDLIVVYSAANSQEAHLLKGLLAQREIEAVVQNDALQGAAGGLQMGKSLSPNVAVWGSDLPKARDVVIAFQRQQEIGPPQVDDVFPDAEAELLIWPECPECGERRATSCQTCAATGTDFPMADFQVELIEPAVEPDGGSCGCGSGGGCGAGEGDPTAEDDVGESMPLLLRCDSCDEVFQPRFYRICTGCGHDFGSGQVRTAQTAEPLNDRTRLVLAGLGIGAFAAVVYMLYLMSR